MQAHSFLKLWVLFFFFSTADSYFGYGLIRCLFDSKREVEYLEQIFFNKVPLGEFNSTLGKYVGFNEKTQKIAEELNKSRGFLEQAMKNKKRCEAIRDVMYAAIKQTVEPSVTLRSVKSSSVTHPGILVCSAFNFYPKKIKLTWLSDGRELTSGVMTTEELSNGNWLYQVHSQLEVKPSTGEKIFCRVEHASLNQPKLYEWDSRTPADRAKFALGTVGLVLGVVVLLGGLIFYMCNQNVCVRGQQLVSTTEQ